MWAVACITYLYSTPIGRHQVGSWAVSANGYIIYDPLRSTLVLAWPSTTPQEDVTNNGTL